MSVDRAFIRAGVEALPDYLISDNLFGTVIGAPGDPRLPHLTLGGLLLTIKREKAKATTPADLAEIEAWNRKFEAQRLSRPAAWENKCKKEFQIRLNLWRNFLYDYRLHPERYHDVYSHEVRWRVMLELLKDELPLKEADHDTLSALDLILKAHMYPSDFIWEEAEQPVFQEEKFWFLYNRLHD